MMVIKAFTTEDNSKLVPAVSFVEFNNIIKKITDAGMPLDAIYSASGFSEAMVLRAALGLSAAEAKVLVLADSSLFGQCAIASVRALAGAGSNLVVGDLSCGLLNLDLSLWAKNILSLSDEQEAVSFINSNLDAHALLLAFDIEKFKFNSLIQTLNDLPMPIHTIGCPYGIDLHNGNIVAEPLFASSTLALGMPFEALVDNKDYVGRLYLSDIYFPLSEYLNLIPDYASVFDSQPVVQIFWLE